MRNKSSQKKNIVPAIVIPENRVLVQSAEYPLAGLLNILRIRRPHDSKAEKAFVYDFIVNPIRKMGYEVQFLGPMGNVLVSTDDDSRTVFSCHTDTVHREGGPQDLAYDKELGMIYNGAKDGGVLGADDGTGVWLMLEMLRAKIPGTYIFHRGEEHGGIGSSWIAKHRESFLRWHKHAVAFDRKGTTSVITHQRGGRCCSDTFAKALGEQLGPDWVTDNTGTFTDTANYTHLVSECTNISVGYYDQHSKNEMQDANFAIELLEKLKAVKWAELPAVREAKKEVYVPQYSRGGLGAPFYRNEYAPGKVWDPKTMRYIDPPARSLPADPSPVTPITKNASIAAADVSTEGYKQMTFDELDDLGFRAIRKLCMDDPDWAADKLIELIDEVRAQKKDHLRDIDGVLEEIDTVKDDIVTVDKRMDDFETIADNIINANVDRDKRIEDLEREVKLLLGAGASASKTVN